MRTVWRHVRPAALLWLALLGVPLTFAGCSRENPVKIVLTTGFAGDELFRLEDTACTRQEFMVYLTNEQNRYEAVYGSGLWERKLEGKSLEERLKDKALAEISQVKAMTLLADLRGITLSEQEEKKVQEAAARYGESLDEAERAAMEVDAECLEGMYRDYALADKVYREIIRDINPEISDDEARTITVQHVRISTVAENGDGTVTPLSETEKEKRYQTAKQVQAEAAAGESFESLMEKYSDEPQGTISFGKGEMEPGFEEAAFNLGNGEISGVVETSAGYEIIKCISTFNREETDRNKEKIVEQRKAEVFGQEYDAFVDSLARNLNEPMWESITLIREDGVDTDDFFQIYREYFPAYGDPVG